MLDWLPELDDLSLLAGPGASRRRVAHRRIACGPAALRQGPEPDRPPISAPGVVLHAVIGDLPGQRP